MQRLRAKQRPWAMELTKVAQGDQSIHLQRKHKVGSTLLHVVHSNSCHLCQLLQPTIICFSSFIARLHYFNTLIITAGLTFRTLTATNVLCSKLIHTTVFIITVPSKENTPKGKT